MEIKTISKEETQELAVRLAKNLKPGDVVALYGELGAGKTIFVQGLARGLQIKKKVSSPSFVFERLYPIKLSGKNLVFRHIDLYRGRNKEDFEGLGLNEIFLGNSIIAIEWASKIKDKLPKKRIDVEIKNLNGRKRLINIKRS